MGGGGGGLHLFLNAEYMALKQIPDAVTLATWGDRSLFLQMLIGNLASI